LLLPSSFDRLISRGGLNNGRETLPQIVSFEELLMANTVTQEAIVTLLHEKRFFIN
jgi:hypothetical protein